MFRRSTCALASILFLTAANPAYSDETPAQQSNRAIHEMHVDGVVQMSEQAADRQRNGTVRRQLIVGTRHEASEIRQRYFEARAIQAFKDAAREREAEAAKLGQKLKGVDRMGRGQFDSSLAYKLFNDSDRLTPALERDLEAALGKYAAKSSWNAGKELLNVRRVGRRAGLIPAALLAVSAAYEYAPDPRVSESREKVAPALNENLSRETEGGVGRSSISKGLK